MFVAMRNITGLLAVWALVSVTQAPADALPTAGLKVDPIEGKLQGDTLILDVDFIQGSDDEKNQWRIDRPITPLLELSILPKGRNPKSIRGQWVGVEKDRAVFLLSRGYLGKALRLWPRVQASRSEFRYPLIPWESDCAVRIEERKEIYWAMTFTDSAGVLVKRCAK